MLKSPLLFAIGVLVSLMSWTGIAQASDKSLALSFALPPTSHTVAAQQSKSALEKEEGTQGITATPIATETAIAPISHTIPHSQQQHTVQAIEIATGTPKNNELKASLSNTDHSKDDIGLHFAATTLTLPTEQSVVASHNKHPQPVSSNPASNNPVFNNPRSNALTSSSNAAPALAFEPETVAYDALGLDDWIFEGGSNSLVAHTVGSAEGTRQWNGKRTQAYYGHEDPGNGVWNLGTFSYQHAARSPEDADRKQLIRLKNQGFQLEQQATSIGISLSLEEKLNGLDLANQAPLAALGKGGYIERLDQAYRMHMTGFEAISWARTRAYIDPDTQAWNAPGLGNNLHSISQDQERRMAAINKALRAYNQDDTTVRALAKFDSISLEHPSLESDELSRWDIHLTTSGSQSQPDTHPETILSDTTTANRPANSAPDGAQAHNAQLNSPQVNSPQVNSTLVENRLDTTKLAALTFPVELPADNEPVSTTNSGETDTEDSTDAVSLTASLATLSFGLPPSNAVNTTPTELPNHPVSLVEQPEETERLTSNSLSLETSDIPTSSQTSLALEFAATEETIALRDNEQLAPISPIPESLTALAETQATSTTHSPANLASSLTVATDTITTSPSTAITQVDRERASQPLTSANNPKAAPKEGLESLQRFEDPTALGPVATAPRPQASNNDTVDNPEENLNQPLDESTANRPNNRSRWKIRIEDRVIDRK